MGFARRDLAAAALVFALAAARGTLAARGQPWSAPIAPVAAWRFARGATPFRDVVNGYELQQHDPKDPVALVNASAPFARAAAFGWPQDGVAATSGHRLYVGRTQAPRLVAIAGPLAEVSVVAWVRLGAHPQNWRLHGGFVGGVWEEDQSWRQYAMFMDHTGGCTAKDGLVAHISPEGGPSPGQQYCHSRACGATALPTLAWHCLSMTYDGHDVRAYVNGSLDARSNATGRDVDNPFKLPNHPVFPNGGIFAPPPGEGANFSMGANFIHPGGGKGPGVLGNKFEGLLGAFAVFNSSMSPEQLVGACASLRS